MDGNEIGYGIIKIRMKFHLYNFERNNDKQMPKCWTMMSGIRSGTKDGGGLTSLGRTCIESSMFSSWSTHYVVDNTRAVEITLSSSSDHMTATPVKHMTRAGEFWYLHLQNWY
jgi:hypothetical protein